MKRLVLPLAGLFLLAAACSDDDNPTPPTCDPACGGCQTCDTSGATPVCVDVCSAGMTCQNAKCVAPAESKCDPACGPCQQCDTSGATPTCVDVCATGTSCQNNQCVPPTVAKCEPACGDCEMCDTSGATPQCVKLCGAGTECKSGACVTPGDACQGACKSCQRCDTDHGVPTCVDTCPKDTTCDTTASLCKPNAATASFDHSTLTELSGPFNHDLAGMKAITAICLKCHPQAGADMLNTAHWKWIGETPGLKGHETGATVGKNNLINNFCVAVPSNEQRCAHCHAGYGYTDKNFDFSATNVNAIDCLVCHASTGYAKAQKTGGLPDPAEFAGLDLVAAAKSVGKPTRAACGRCHFKAGGGDNVKKGDLGSALTTPTAAADVHMGAATNPFTCSTCHKGTAHKIVGKGVHLPVSEGRMDCVDCHGNTPHISNKATLDNHAKDIACQTCHIPAFSRQQPTKVDWDWSTAGNMTRGTNGIEKSQTPIGGTNPIVYDAKKGDFVWEANVRPSYAWYNGAATRMTINDKYPASKGDTKTNRINLGGPTATFADMDAKIYPFKRMLGKQAVDPTRRLVLAPKLFGGGGFWKLIPQAADYTAAKVEANWSAALSLGAKYSGQLQSGDPDYTGRGTGANQWDWAYTEMWMQINHEVAPKGQALSCGSCHGGGQIDWTALGYKCDPMSGGGAAACGSRHP
jgi:octaheme c-type cytochrome (tetrathionate reductase family)